MNLQECIRFTNDNPVCYLATTEGDQPRVRALGFWFADETGFYFQTGSIKQIPGQLEKNPLAEACFYKPENGLGTMLRVSGKVEFLTERSWKEKALTDRPFLIDMGMTAESPGLVLFRIPHGEVRVWTMESNLKPNEILQF